MKKTIIILVLAFLCQFSCTPVLISKKKAIEIAMKNGMKQGIEAPVAILVDGKFWEVKCLMCDDGGESESFIVKINATTGKIERPSINEISISSYAGEQPGKTRMDLWTDIDNIPVRSSANKPYRLTNLKEGSEFNAVISPDDQVVAYQYGINKIGVNNLNGQGFIKICDECQNPQWIGNDWIAYLKYSNRIYKKNIKTQEEIPVTLNVIQDPDFQISPDYRWIAYTSMRGDGTNMISSINGNGQELCLQSVDGKKMQFVTKTGSYVNTPVWKGDSLFFYINSTAYRVIDLDTDSILYTRTTWKKLDMVPLRDYRKIVNGIFPVKVDCKIVGIDAKSLDPRYILINEPGRYGDLVLTKDLKYLIYSQKESKKSESELWVLKYE